MLKSNKFYWNLDLEHWSSLSRMEVTDYGGKLETGEKVQELMVHLYHGLHMGTLLMDDILNPSDRVIMEAAYNGGRRVNYNISGNVHSILDVL